MVIDLLPGFERTRVGHFARELALRVAVRDLERDVLRGLVTFIDIRYLRAACAVAERLRLRNKTVDDGDRVCRGCAGLRPRERQECREHEQRKQRCETFGHEGPSS